MDEVVLAGAEPLTARESSERERETEIVGAEA